MLVTHPAGTPVSDILDAVARDGGTIVEGFLSEEEADALANDFQPHLDAAPWGNTHEGLPDTFFGLRTKRLHGLLGRSPRVGPLLLHPTLRALRERFLKPHCHGYRFSTGELMALGKGETSQVLHRDADSWLHFERPRPEILVSANIALTAFTEDNGATLVVPGSHRWPPDRKPEVAEAVKAVMKRGSALLYSGDVWHGGGANATDAMRVGLYLGFILSWLRPLENHLITSGEAALRAAPEEAQRLCDFSPAGWDVLP